MEATIINIRFLHLRLNLKLNVEIFEFKNFISQKQKISWSTYSIRNWTRNFVHQLQFHEKFNSQTNNASESVGSSYNYYVWRDGWV